MRGYNTMTIHQRALAQGLKSYDYALPQAWFNAAINLTGENPFGHVVWSYDDDKVSGRRWFDGRPHPLDFIGLRICLKMSGSERWSLYGDHDDIDNAFVRPTVRFWIFENGAFVRITLTPSRNVREGSAVVSHTTGGPHDEGYSYTTRTFIYDKYLGEVTEEEYTEARDCDGRMDYFRSRLCPIGLLDEREYSEDRVWNYTKRVRDEVYLFLPLWQETDHSQRDYSAEAMGY